MLASINEQKRILRKAVSRLLRAQLSPAFNKLSEFSKRMTHVEAIMTSFVLRILEGALHFALSRWREETDRCSKERVVLGTVIRRLVHAKLWGAFEAWRHPIRVRVGLRVRVMMVSKWMNLTFE